MTPLGLPLDAARENQTIKTLCKAPKWAACHAAWQTAYDRYRLEGGDPWKVLRTSFSTDQDETKQIAETQRNLYKTRCGGGPIAKIRRTPGLLCCPMCGSQHPGTVDHYLPKDSFPEFSILACNLLPACPHCNSGVKQGRYKGDSIPERFIHPYFDTIAKDPIWYVEIKPPFEAARFEAQVADCVDNAWIPTVRFHLNHTLGEVFEDHISTQWSLLPRLIHCFVESDNPISELVVLNNLQRRLRETAITDGVNGWHTAFLRGVVRNHKAISFLTSRAISI